MCLSGAFYGPGGPESVLAYGHVCHGILFVQRCAFQVPSVRLQVAGLSNFIDVFMFSIFYRYFVCGRCFFLFCCVFHCVVSMLCVCFYVCVCVVSLCVSISCRKTKDEIRNSSTKKVQTRPNIVMNVAVNGYERHS